MVEGGGRSNSSRGGRAGYVRGSNCSGGPPLLEAAAFSHVVIRHSVLSFVLFFDSSLFIHLCVYFLLLKEKMCSLSTLEFYLINLFLL